VSAGPPRKPGRAALHDRRRPRRSTDPARQAAVEVVLRTLEGAYLAPTLGAALDDAGLEGAPRSFVTDLAYGSVRYLAFLDAALAPRLEDPRRLPPRVLAALRLGAYELLIRGTPRHAAVHAWVDVVKTHAPGLAGLTNAVLRRVEPPPHAAEDDSVRFSLPGWLWQRFVQALGTEAAQAAAGMLEPEPLWLTAFTATAAAQVRADGCEVGDGPVASPSSGEPHDGGEERRDVPRSLRVRCPMPLDRVAAYREGAVQPQNPASLFAALLLGARPGDVALDLAAGQGIKSAVLAAQGADVTAVEIDPRRSRAAEANLRRLGLAVRHVVADLLDPPPFEPAPRVLLDAPCSGSGTLRGHPEIKLRLDEPQVARLATNQRAMLARAADLVAPGGTLVYAVCSLTPEEGPEVVADLLSRRDDLTPEAFDAPVASVASGAGRFLLPVDGLDGFYLARLRRRS
jgi:16S rRNA (cytosine967-C5)-methyltransferase